MPFGGQKCSRAKYPTVGHPKRPTNQFFSFFFYRELNVRFKKLLKSWTQLGRRIKLPRVEINRFSHPSTCVTLTIS